MKDQFLAYIKNLQDTITSKLEEVDGKAQFKEDDKKPGLLSSIVSMFTGGSSDIDNSKLIADQKQSSTTIINNNNNISQNTDNSVSNSSMVNKMSVDHNESSAAYLSSSGSERVAVY